jgi:hypothetical protein
MSLGLFFKRNIKVLLFFFFSTFIALLFLSDGVRF